jgi:hypothetical protein
MTDRLAYVVVAAMVLAIFYPLYLGVTMMREERDAQAKCLASGYPTMRKAHGKEGFVFYCEKRVNGTDVVMELKP